MNIDLLDALEVKIENAIQTIADLRKEVDIAKQARDEMQNKLQSVMDKIGSLDSQLEDATKSADASTEGSSHTSTDNTDNTSSATSNVIGFSQSSSLGGSSSTEASSLRSTGSPYEKSDSSNTESNTGGSSSYSSLYGTGTHQ